MAQENGLGMSMDLHSTGQPDTPVEYLVSVLGQALRAHDPQQMRGLVQDAYNLIAGLDPYLDSISTPPSHVRVPVAHWGLCQSLTSEMADYMVLGQRVYVVIEDVQQPVAHLRGICKADTPSTVSVRRCKNN